MNVNLKGKTVKILTPEDTLQHGDLVRLIVETGDNCRERSLYYFYELIRV